MINILLILSIFIFVPILGIPDSFDLYIYLAAFGLFCFEWLRLWKTKKIFRQRVTLVKIEIKKFLKSFFKEEKIAVHGQDELTEDVNEEQEDEKSKEE